MQLAINFYFNSFLVVSTKTSLLKTAGRNIQILQLAFWFSYWRESIFFEPCYNISIILLMINKIIASSQQIGNAEKMEVLIHLKEILD